MWIKKIEQAKSVLDKILKAICAFLMAFMSILVVYQVVMRYVFVKPSTFSEDLLTYSFVWLSLIATAVVFSARDHMALSIIADGIKGKPKLILNLFTELVILVITYVIFVDGGLAFMRVGARQTSPTLHILMSKVYVIMPIVGVITIIYCILNSLIFFSRLVKSGKEDDAA